MDPAATVTAQFAAITGSSNQIAAQYLRLAEGNTEQAIELFYANDGGDLEASSAPADPTQTSPQVPPPHTRPTGHRQGYEDEAGIVHIDSDPEDRDYNDNEDDMEIMSHERRQLSNTELASTSQGTATKSPGRAAAAIADDEAMARRLQEEFYGAAKNGNFSDNASSEILDEHGYRAPLARTTETLVGPGSFDPSNAEEMRAAVMEQMMARRQQPRALGK